MTYGERGDRVYSYFGGDVVETAGVGDYVAAADGALSPTTHDAGIVDFQNPHPDFTFQHGIADIVSAVLDAGFTLRTFREYAYSNGAQLFSSLVPVGGRRFGTPPGIPPLPLMFGLVAERR